MSRGGIDWAQYDLAREHVIQFLALCLVQTSSYRHAILEELVRSDIVDQFPVRPTIVKELLGKVAYEAQRKELEGLIETNPQVISNSFSYV